MAYLVAEVLVTDEISMVGLSSRAKALPNSVGADDGDALFRRSLLGDVVVCLSPSTLDSGENLGLHVGLGDSDALASFPSCRRRSRILGSPQLVAMSLFG